MYEAYREEWRGHMCRAVNELFVDEITEMKAIIAAKLQQPCNVGFFIQLVKSRFLIPYVLTIR